MDKPDWHCPDRSVTPPTLSIPMLNRLFYLVLILNLLPIQTFAQGSIQTILIEGAPALDGNGTFGRQFAGATFGKAVINETGQVAFTGQMKDTSGGIFDMQGLFLYEPGTDEVIQIARTGQKAPGTVGDFFSFGGSSSDSTPFLTLNDTGLIGIFATATGDPGFPDMSGTGPHLFSREGATRLAMIGATDPRALGSFKSFFYHGLANNGQVGIPVTVEIDAFTIPFGMIITDAEDDSLNTILMEDDTVPGGSATFTGIDFRGFNNLGYALIMGDDSDGDDGEPGSQDLWVASVDTMERIVNDGDTAPGGNGVFEEIFFADINDSNEVVFAAELAETSGGGLDDFGLFLKDAEDLHIIAREGDGVLPGGPAGPFGSPRINEAGQIASFGQEDDVRGIYLFTKEAASLLVKTGDPVPEGEGAISFSTIPFPQIWLNDSGQVLFQTRISGVGDEGNEGAYLVGPDGFFEQVVRLGQSLEGSTVEAIDIVGAGTIPDAGLGYGNQRPMNNAGQVVFWAELADGRDGIFLWSMPSGGNDPLIGGTPVDGLEGWFYSDWFGYYSTTLSPWIFHAEHGFIYRDPGSSNASMFVFDDAMVAWWWTSESNYPFLYAFDPPADNAGTDITSAWLWYFEETKTPRSFGVVTGNNAGSFLYFGP